MTTMITYKGRKQSISAWARTVGLSQQTLYSRLSAGWSIQRALATPKLKSAKMGLRGANKAALAPQLSAFDQYLENHRSFERAFKRALREFARSLDKQMADLNREAAKVMASEMHLQEVARRYGVTANGQGPKA